MTRGCILSQSPPHSPVKKQETLRIEIATVWFSVKRGRRTLACSSVHAFGGVSRVVEILSCSRSSADSPPPSGRRSKCERSSVCTKNTARDAERGRGRDRGTEGWRYKRGESRKSFGIIDGGSVCDSHGARQLLKEFSSAARHRHLNALVDVLSLSLSLSPAADCRRL